MLLLLSIAAIASPLRSSATLGGSTFALLESYRDVEKIMARRGIVVTYEAIREWCLKFGQTYANELRRRRP